MWEYVLSPAHVGIHTVYSQIYQELVVTDCELNDSREVRRARESSSNTRSVPENAGNEIQSEAKKKYVL